MTTKLFLIRHGITQWNKERRYCGYRDIALSKEGKNQIIKLRKYIKTIDFDSIYSSDRLRALETKSILFGNNKFKIIRDLREIHFGVLEGLRHEDIIKKYPKIYTNWLKDPHKGRIPKAENFPVFKKRIVKAIKKIARLNQGKTVAIVCHGGVIGSFIGSVLKSRDFWGHVPKASSLTLVEYKNSKFKIIKFNDTAHLR